MTPHYTVAGVQDGSFEAFYRGTSSAKQYTALCCATLERDRILDVNVDRILVDGLDSTNILLNNLEKTEVEVIILGGATFGGFNVMDVEYVYKKTGIPVIVYSGIFPDMEATRDALRKHFPDWKKRWARYEALGEINKFESGRYPEIYFEKVGCTIDFAEQVLDEQTITCRMPEAVRVADIIAKGLSPIFQSQEVFVDGSSN
ncbi:DUF99 family protein [Candidatus Bathyarchaeota archaeon]|nr:DUF99 family protein [Candidatus Bathyarchaeota archaeon]